MKFEDTEVWGFESAIKLLRATDDMEKSDSGWKGFCNEDNKWVSERCSYDACLNSDKSSHDVLNSYLDRGWKVVMVTPKPGYNEYIIERDIPPKPW